MCKECENAIIKQPHKDEDEYWKIRFQCKDCNEDTNNSIDYYMVEDNIWLKYGVDGMLCITCIEKRMGHKLTPNDFSDCPLNLIFNPAVRLFKMNVIKDITKAIKELKEGKTINTNG